MNHFTVVITFKNGSHDSHSFPNYLDAKRFCQNISYSGGRVRRVKIKEPDSGSRAMWDSTWDTYSQHRGLYD